MDLKKSLPYVLHLGSLTIVLGIFGYIISSFSLLFFYILSSLLLAGAINAYFDRMHAIDVSRNLSGVLLVGVLLVCVLGFVLHVAPGILEDIALLQADFPGIHEDVNAFLSFLPEFMIDEVEELSYGALKDVFVPWFAQITQNLLQKVVGAMIIIPILTLILLKDTPNLKKHFFARLPNRYFEISLATFDDIIVSVKRFLLAKMIQFLILFTVSSLMFFFLGFPMPILLGFLIGLLNIIPYFGPILGVIPPITVALLSEGDLLLPALSVVVVAQIIDNFVLQPILLPSLIAEPPLIVMIVTLAGATIAGPVGMILAVPVYSILKSIYLRYYQALRLLYSDKKEEYTPMIS